MGCGFVADLYLASLRSFPEITVIGVHDRDASRMQACAAHWGVPALPDLAKALAEMPADGLVLNLTNPTSHSAVIRQSLEAQRHVFSEKPMVLSLDDAKSLTELATSNGVQLGTAPSSVLSHTAQNLGYALRQKIGGTPRLIYAELDDGFIPQAPLEAWISDSGAPWPFADEFRIGCTLEHAGYYLSWLIAHLGPVSRVVTATAEVLPNKRDVQDCAPDFSVATLSFASGPTARLTCSISAPHDHRLRIIGDEGVLEVRRAWDNFAPVRYRRRMRIRRRLLEHPFGKTISSGSAPHPKLPRKGAAAMNFALGPAEMLQSIAAGCPSRLSGAYALHLTEVTLACQKTGVHDMTTSCEMMEPMSWQR